MSSGSAEPRDILDAAEEGEAMIVGAREKGNTGRRSNDGLSHAESRLDDCDKTPPLLRRVEVGPSRRTIFPFAPVFRAASLDC